jgi:hypothetical protein
LNKLRPLIRSIRNRNPLPKGPGTESNFHTAPFGSSSTGPREIATKEIDYVRPVSKLLALHTYCDHRANFRYSPIGRGINTIPTYEEQTKAKWSDVQNQYQRRADLIPNLVETVKGFAKQESTVLEAVTNARARATSIQINAETISDPEAFKKFQEAQAQLSGALGRLLAVTENYPDLKSNQGFLALQSQLEGTENRIAVTRRDYI